MPSLVSEVVFSEPSGRPQTLVQFSSALFFLGLYAYAWSVGNATSSLWLLGMVVGTALSGTAEALPKQHRWVAGVLRLAAILVIVTVLAATVFVPELVVV
ncbi:hypothetical protein Harman_10650 [Haloarcula mannanilytica]|uniref:Uncharacterized protein n=1 Tax=Haloarcula mannanilytica TaxID=2509225 RepID=A0A4C2EII3_9EURY|nr:hypothetical protein [Haloarcula mannanilytica]GCF13130.1 hypothetical protein Harman_10650 [Haloarcula mannanilytica]